MSLVLVASRRGNAPIAASDSDACDGDSPATPRTDLWRAVRHEVGTPGSHARRHAGPDDPPGDLAALASAVATDEADPVISYATSPADAVRAVERRIAAGATAIAIVPIAMTVDTLARGLADPGLARLHDAIGQLAAGHPDVELQYVGPPFEDAPALEAAIAALRPVDADDPARLALAIERAFDGDVDRFGRFMRALQRGLPSGTVVALRGSAVQGASYATGEPFDGRGTGSSDLDVVLLGEEAMACWRPDGFYLPGINTQPLDDASPSVADPALDRARREAQSVAGRPVALQAMARWFLDLRSGLQGTPYVILDG